MYSHLLFLYWIKLLIPISTASKIIFHKTNGVYDDEIYAIRGDQCGSGMLFKSSQEFSCVCTTGLWALFKENCQQTHMLVGGTKEQCIHIDFPVHKAVLVSPIEDFSNLSSATVFDKDMASMGEKFVSSGEIPNKAHFAPTGFPIIITTGNQTWRLPLQQLCLAPNQGDKSDQRKFCIFNTGVIDEYRIDESGCSEEDQILAPIGCTSFMDDEDAESRSCSTRKRRKVKKHRVPQGRAFLDTIQSFNENATESESGYNQTEADENFNLTGGSGSTVMNSELWNYMTLRAQQILNIREKREKDKSEGIYEPAFTFLELAKDIQKKACPDHYVPDEHYEVAVGAFITILKNHFKFTDQFLDFATSERIEDTLRACLANITEYPFLERTPKPPEGGWDCDDVDSIEHGDYWMFEQILNMTIGHDQACRSNEPIIETVWKIFIHAHSACYGFFENNLNDHHRFATVMLQLFTSEINDIWFNITELEKDIYSGFLGDAVDLMDSVAYCSMFSRLESKYPWDLPRPKKYNAGGEGASPSSPAGDGGGRRKREAIEGSEDFRCLQERDALNFCQSVDPISFWGDDDDNNIIRKYT